MQPALSACIPDGFMAAMRLGVEKPHQGVRSQNPAPNQVREVCNFTVLLGLRGQAELNRVGSRSTGKERDTESGNDYFMARYYSSSMGRFMSPDWSAKEEPVPYAKLDDPQTLNLYSYVQNNPLTRADADGHVAGVDDAAEGIIAVAVLGAFTLEAVAQYYNHTPDAQRSLNGAVDAAGQGLSSGVQTIKDKVSSLFSKQAAPGSRPGQDFTKAGKKTIDSTNAANHGGDNKCDKCDKKVKKVASEKGEPTPDDQLQRHHIDPKANAGSGTPENGQVLCPDCHQAEHAPQPKPTPQPNQ